MTRISFVTRCLEDDEVYSLLRPYVAEWFRRRYGSFTLPQRCAIPLIKRGENVLVSSPTGTGKTLAVFLGIIDELFRLGEEGRLQDQIYAVYVSPLRALNNDMRRNLLEPLHGIRQVASEMGIQLPEVRVAVRTSDTSPSEKQEMVRRPPHILITTPESLTIALVAPKFRERLATTRWIVIDEIHELASSKRGSLLSLTLERLEELVGGRLQRIGLSATIAPLEEVAKFLVGFDDNGEPRSCKIVDARFAKPIDIRVLCPVRDLINTPAEEVNEAIYRLLARLVMEHRTTLVFTNTRSATERVVYKLRKLLAAEGIADMDEIEAHHSSLSRDLRLEVEEKLKRGELKVVVSSTSLELGIDIGYIDLVVLLSSPKSVSRLLQRVGRAGHHIRQVSKGRIIVVDRDDLVECTVLAKAAMERKIDRVHIPRNPLDILAQHLVGMALERRWKIEEAYKLVRRSYSFHTLDYRDFINTLRYLAGLYPDTLEEMKVYAKIWLDEEKGEFGKKRSTRAIYAPNVGAIPDEAKIHVYTRDGRYVGDLEEAFVQILSPGDIFVLGGRTYRFIRSEGARVIVEPVEGVKPTVPVWFSEMLPLAFDSALLVGEFRRKIAEAIMNGVSREEIVDWLVREYLLERHAAENIYEYIREQVEFTGGKVPNDRMILVELFIDDESETSNVIFHSLFGRRVNDALSRAYAYYLAEWLAKPVRITVSDNGFMLTVDGTDAIDMDLVVKLSRAVKSRELRDILKRVLRNTELLKRRFRHCAERALMILRRYRGRERSVHRMQINAQALLQAVEQLGDFPVLKEAYREILEDYMDVANAEQVLRWVEEGRVKLDYFGPTRVPSPFAHHLVVKGYSDVVLMEDRRRLLAELHRRVMELLAARRGNSRSGEEGEAVA
ncbi:DEAD/H associated domain protein [Pyrolobus fumarii 1A]|uniref:DEAD/H associated domain protein n=1 Tax=Pyrolobus fumarii (strain DSM 11204 / 1A) TaxID=694429 RepID=G0EFD2_PYRF1|nr:ATP-dependent helicase [Pyrolobus fumarii]AEM38175.1 DEAD/H associated domain protein [Pyrolobus fumarii 1A]